MAAIVALKNHSGQHFVLGQNLHSAYLYRKDQQLKALYDRAAIVIADGKPVQVDTAITMRLRKGLAVTRVERIGSTDWLEMLVRTGAFSRIAVIGAIESANVSFITLLKQHCSSATYLSLPGELWNSKSEENTVTAIQTFKPDLVLIGLGMPLQESFLIRNVERIPEAIYVVVGGAIDQLSGVQALAPRWLGRIGLEWLWRLCAHPRRLAYRYSVEPALLLVERTREVWRLLSDRSRPYEH
ncbi:WecB/TagA/CpsF family glycosyltransferase [Changpingibacter yushuensis]|uniref:WecB/TagA/CpsF family glycosyltransferase n=1 Tax=Changpingibacter yushuensis TaxID=2758440 RepID=UPI0015F4F6D7|nr:WecB/TagA/CpsF family glycosyltransferase [Changpingibacter yushuensis]